MPGEGVRRALAELCLRVRHVNNSDQALTYRYHCIELPAAHALMAHGNCAATSAKHTHVLDHVYLLAHPFVRLCDGTSLKPRWPNGQGVGLLIRRLRVRVPQGVLSISCEL